MNNLSYSKGFALDSDIFVIVAEYDDARDAGEDHSEIFQFVKGKWFHYLLDFTGIGVVVVSNDGVNHVVTVGVDGEFHEAARTGNLSGVIDGTRERPENRGALRCVRVVDGQAIVAGMGRQIYRRVGPGRWERMDQGILLPLGTEEIKGFNAIDGVSMDDLHAVGFDGEICWFNGKKWNQAESVTNVGLHSIKAVPGGNLYLAGGSAGVLLRGRENKWDVIAHDLDIETIRSIEVLGEQTFVATNDSVYRLSDGLEMVDVPKEGGTFGVLHAANGVLWSLGQRDIFFYDGKEWKELRYDG